MQRENVEEATPMDRIRHIGMDVDKDGINLAVFDQEQPRPTLEKRILNDPPRIAREMRRLAEEGYALRTCYEAGPCGYELKRLMDRLGVECIVVAPGLVPRRPTDRVKTNRRDADKLGRMLRANELDPIHVPTPQTEAVRDLIRAREALKDDLMRRRHRLSKFLLRHGRVYRSTPWMLAHRRWLTTLSWELPALQETCEQYRYALQETEERLKRCDAQIAAYAEQEPWREPVRRLRCFRGIDTLSAMGLLTEIEDCRRFPDARAFMAFVGLTVSEYSPGTTRHQGGITKTGNGHVRRLLVEAAWSSRHRPVVGYGLRQRRRGQSEGVIRLADRAIQRLYRRFHRLVSRGKPSTVAVVAVARELAGLIWASQVDPNPA